MEERLGCTRNLEEKAKQREVTFWFGGRNSDTC
jgi:hypothetical protein